MKENNETWRSNDEHRASLRMAIYEAKKENPRKTYEQLGKEYGVSSIAANSLVTEFCKLFNHKEPPVVIKPGERYDRKNLLPVGTRIEIDGRGAILIEELVHSIQVLLEDTNEMVYVSRLDLSINSRR